MFDVSNLRNLENSYRKIDTDAYERHIAHGMFEKALGAGNRRKVFARLTGRSRELRSLTDERHEAKVRGERYLGLQTVAINAIRGSEGRSQDFDNEFNPVRAHTEQRWMSVASAMLRGVTLPPVELIKMGDTYYVRDGHHRISVAKAQGQTSIEAVVTVWETDGEALYAEALCGA